MVLAICVSAIIGILQSVLLYLAVSSAMNNRIKKAIMFFIIKTAAYVPSAFLLLNAGKEHIIPAAVSFGVCFAALSFAFAVISIRKNNTKKNDTSE